MKSILQGKKWFLCREKPNLKKMICHESFHLPALNQNKPLSFTEVAFEQRMIHLGIHLEQRILLFCLPMLEKTDLLRSSFKTNNIFFLLACGVKLALFGTTFLCQCNRPLNWNWKAPYKHWQGRLRDAANTSSHSCRLRSDRATIHYWICLHYKWNEHVNAPSFVLGEDSSNNIRTGFTTFWASPEGGHYLCWAHLLQFHLWR